MSGDDPHDLARFVDAQAPVIGQVFAELAAGRKQTHWMWFIFPQLRGLGRSAMAEHYGIGSVAEARAYMAHPLLGARLHKAATLVLAAKAASPEAIFGPIDALKFRSSMSLFALACGDETCQAALDRWYDGQPDPETVRRLRAPPFRS